jgi:hypothetical protein
MQSDSDCLNWFMRADDRILKMQYDGRSATIVAGLLASCARHCLEDCLSIAHSRYHAVIYQLA